MKKLILLIGSLMLVATMAYSDLGECAWGSGTGCGSGGSSGNIAAEGMSGDRVINRHINDQTAGAQSYLPLSSDVFLAGGASQSFALYTFHTTIPADSNMRIMAQAGGGVRADAMSIRLVADNPTIDAHDCSWTIYKSELISNVALPTGLSKGAPTGMTACGGQMFTGPTNSNTGGTGDTLLKDAGDNYVIPQTSCECAADECFLIVAVADVELASCDSILDLDVTIFISELAL